MATDILVITSNPQDFADGAWPRLHFNGDAGSGKFHWRFSHTASTQGAWGAYFGRPTGGVWRTNSGTIEIYDTADNLLISRAVTIPVGSYVDFTVDANTGSLILANFSSGNGTFSYTPADIFTTGGLRVGGVFGQTGWSIAGTFSNVDDADPTSSGAGTASGTATVTAGGASIAAGAGTASGTSTAAAVSTAPGGSGASDGTSTVAGIGASIVAADGSAAGSSTVGAASPSPLSVGIGAVVQRINSTQPPTGTLATWSTDLTVSAITTTTDTLTSAGHGFIASTFPGPFYLATTGTFPAGSDGVTPYWVVVVDADNFRLATSGQNAKAGTVVNLTNAGSGTISLVRVRNSEASGSAFITLVMRGVWSSDSSAATDNKGNDYTDRNDEYAYAAFPGSRVRARVDVSATGGAAHIVQATWGNIGGTGDEVTTSIVEVKGATLCKAFARNETAVGSASITTPAVSTSDEALVLVALCGNGPVSQDHTWTAVDGTWTKHVPASAEQDTSSNGYIQITWYWKKFATAQTNLTAQFSGINNEGAQAFVWVLQTKDPAPGAGSASGSVTATAVGASITAGAGAATGTSTTTAEGGHLGSIGAASGISTVAGLGAAIVSGSGDAAGASAVAAAGAAIASGQGATAGSSTTTSSGAATTAGTGEAAGTSSATAQGQATAAGAGAASGSVAAAGAGAALAGGAGAAVGAASAGAGGAAVASGSGLAAGAGSAAATGASVAAGAGAAVGTSTAFSSPESGSTGTASGTSAAAGAGAVVLSGVGAASGGAIAGAAGVIVASGAGAAAGSSSTTATASAIAAATGSAAGTSTATGFGLGGAVESTIRLPSVLRMELVGAPTLAVVVNGVTFTVEEF